MILTNMLDSTLNHIRRIIPARLFSSLQRPYHLALSLSAAILYGFPSKDIKIIAVTGTKGKSSTVEIVNAILEEAGYQTALSNTIRFKIGDRSEPNLHKMSMPGRFFMQRFIQRAVLAGCQYIVIEMTSQGALFFRHKYIDIDTLIFTNLSPEHIEAHGSYENYVASKLSIAATLADSSKPNKTLIVNADDKEGERFMACQADRKITYSVHDVEPYTVKKEGLEFRLANRQMRSPLSGLFNLYNIVAAVTCAESEGVSIDKIAAALERFGDIPGRVEKVEAGQDFTVIVDYAHTADSLEKLYKVFRPDPDDSRSGEYRMIGVLGGTGGGRDTSKRAIMGALADRYCDEVILTDEDPYDEDPNKIVADVATGVTSKLPSVIMDRRAAISTALRLAKKGDIILITGKGTDPYIMGPNGTKTSWSDSAVAREEIAKLHA